MTDKQIIIDGVDVKDCKRRIGKDNYCRYYKRPCSENNYNCIWKKYLRKEQECETLASQLDFEVQKKECLEQECERLKEGLNLILTVQKNCKECPHQKLDVDVLVCDLDCATAFKKIAKQTLKKLENKNV